MSTPTPDAAPGPREVTTRERLSWMGRNSRRLIISLAALVAAAAVAVFSFSLFSSSSANPGNIATTGIMGIGNSAEGQAVLVVEDLLPGESGSGTVTIENVGDSAGVFSLSAGNVVDEPATPPLSAVLTLAVTDGGTAVYNGPLGDLGTVDLGTWEAGESHDFTLTVTFAASAGNEYQGAKTTVDLDWDAAQSES